MIQDWISSFRERTLHFLSVIAESVQYKTKPSSIHWVINTTDLKAKFSLGVRVQRDGALGIVTQDRSVLFIAMAP